MTDLVPPQIRTVLKTYQDSAIKSLQGPGLSLVHTHKRELDSPELNEPHLPHLPPPAPEMPQPILSAPDPEHGSLQETTLEGKRIGCYALGGEMRLCFPQILNNILTDFKLDQIYRVFEELRIFCSQCTPEQLIEFKTAKILPDDTKASGLITRTNAERLCSALLHHPDGGARPPKTALSFRVYHRCFGKCEGICTPEMYSFKEPACIECTECRGLFSPQKFVCHVHRQQENQTCHWGFDSGNWRSYLHVVLDEKNRDDFTKILDSLKERETQEAAMYLLNPRDMCHLKRKATLDEPNSLMPPLKSEPLDNIPLKKTKVLMDEAYHHAYHLQYQKALFLAHYPQFPYNRPWAPPLSKQLQHLQFAATTGQPMAYLSQEPPILQNPERVVRSTECERFERSFQPNVALAPKKLQISSNAGSNKDGKDRDKLVDKEMREQQTVIKTEIKQERVSSPSEASNSPSEYCRSTPPEPEVSPRPPSVTQPRLHMHQTTIPPPSHQQQSPLSQLQQPPQPPPPSSHRPSVSPEGQSGSNEITSSTSPVPVINNNNISSCINKAQVELLLINNLSPQPPPRRTPIPSENIHHRISQPSPISLKNGIVNPEFELSTDTDDDSLQGEADSSNHTATLDMAVEVLKDVQPDKCEKVLNLIKILVHENTQLKHVNIKNECLIQELNLRDERILDLEREHEKLKTVINQLQQQQHLQNSQRHFIKMGSVEATIIPTTMSVCKPPENTLEKVVVERRNGYTEKPDVIMKPLKKSHRRQIDDNNSGIVVIKQTAIMQQHEHDNLKENHVIKSVESA